MSSCSGDGYDNLYSTGGLMWGRDNVKNFFVNMCTYYSKGVADYVAVWDFDEHFWPLGNNTNIMDVIRQIEDPVPTSKRDHVAYFHPPEATNLDGKAKEFIISRKLLWYALYFLFVFCFYM